MPAALILSVAVALGAGNAQAQSFGSPIVISGVWGGTNSDNTTAAADPGSPSIAGTTPNKPVWFQWTAPDDGEVTLDTYGSYGINRLTLDTVLGVFTGNSLATLNQVTANDDLYPLNLGTNQFNYTGQNIFKTNTTPPKVSGLLYKYTQPYDGPSGLRFNAKAGRTYYFVVDTKPRQIPTTNALVFQIVDSGQISFNWAYHSSGVFRFATENVDQTGIHTTNGTPMLLYQCAETETTRSRTNNPVNVDEYNTTIHTYYDYNVPGLLVTVTRVSGSSGRVAVDYATADGNPSVITNGDAAAVASRDYYPVSGTLVFDDFEMSKTILIRIIDDLGASQRNRDFTVVLSNPRRVPSESSDVSEPRVDSVFGQALCRILDCDIDPKGLSTVLVVNTNTVPPTTNTATGLTPTNAVFNFEKANYRVPRDVQSGYWEATPVTIYVNRTGATNSAGATINYRINNYFLGDQAGDDQQNIYFPLQPGSDYATPSPASNGAVLGKNSDFAGVGGDSGTLTWADNDFQPKPIYFNIFNDNLTSFNKDFRVELYDTDASGNPIQVGMVAETTVTILFDDLSPPAGSVDEHYNADLGLDLAPPTITVPPRMIHPGTDGEVYGLAVQPDDMTIIVGRFYSYDLTGRNCIARINTNGSLDTTFNPGTGVDPFDSAIQAIALTSSNQVVIAGDFVAYNGTQRNSVARLNANGSLDLTFDPGTGANGPVYAVISQSDGKVLIGGDFTSFNGITRKYIARLKADGSLDTTFDPKNNLNAPVYAMAAEDNTHLAINRGASGGKAEDINSINVGAPAGTLTVDYDMQGTPNGLRVYYGGPNNVLVSDTGLVSGTGQLVIPFGPTNGLNTNVITIVMNQGNAASGVFWSYSASVDVLGASQIAVGGDFTSAGGLANQDHLARMLSDGSMDTTFDPGGGANGTVYSMSRQTDGKLVVGGEFSIVNGQNLNRLARLNFDGSVDTNFFLGVGADSTVYCVNAQTNGTIYIGGIFTAINGTHRLGFARLNSDGTVDTTFLDTAYNQFAGLPRVRFGDTPGTVFTSGVQSDGNVMIGGSFDRVGGGQFSVNVRPEDYGFDPELGALLNQDIWTEPKTRDGIRNRSNVARLIGGATPGPGNISLLYDSYSVNKSQSSIFVSLLRNNGTLGPASANFSIQQGLAQSGLDYLYNSAPPLYWITWEYFNPTRMHSDGLFGTNTVLYDIYGRPWVGGYAGQSSVIVTILNNSLASGDTSAQFQLANPSVADQFYLGGQNIPLGVALGRSVSPLTIIDDHHNAGVFGFSSSDYTVISNATINVRRTGGNYGNVLLNYATTTNGSTAIKDADYRAASGTLNFANAQTNRPFNVVILKTNSVSSVEKTVNLLLFNLQPPVNARASWGLSNAVLRIINPNFQGFLNFTTNVYSTQLSAGTISLTVSRTVGSKGTLTVQCGTTDDTAVNGVDYLGSTNTLQWNNGDVSPKTFVFPLINQGTVSASKQFKAFLFDPQTNGVAAPFLFGPVTNTTLVINNDNSYGTFQFSASSYVVNENGGYATITVTRGATLGSATVDYATADASAFANTNYLATSGTLSLAPGQSLTNFTVTILDDGVRNPSPDNFFFTLSLTNPSAGAVLGSPTTVPVHIVDAESYNRPSGSPDGSFDASAGMNDDVLALALQSNGQVIAGGNFTTVSGVAENHLARLNSDGTLDGANFLFGLSGANGPVRALISQTDNRVVLGGGFTFVNGVVRNYLARLNSDGSLDTSFNPGSGANNSVFSLAETVMGGVRVIYVGGAFTTINGTSSHGVARLNDHGTIDSSFATGIGANGTVYALAVYPTNSASAGKVLIGGNFNNFNGFALNHLARLNVDGLVDTNFVLNLGANDIVRAIAIQNDGAVLIGGDFTNVNGTVVNHIARLHPDGALDAAFASNVGAGVNDIVKAIALQADNRIVLVGDFTQSDGVARNHITRLMPDGKVDTSINFGDGANGAIEALVVQPNDQMLVIGGAFTQFQGQANNHIARIFGGSMAGSGAFEFTSSDYQVDENGVSTVIKVRRTRGTTGPNPDGSGDISVDFATSDGTAQNGINYVGVTNSLAFAPGEVLKTVVIPVIHDSNITDNLTVDLMLSNPSPPAGLGLQPTAVLTIINIDSAVYLSSADYSVAKNDLSGVAAIDVVRQGTTNDTCTVFFTTTTNGTAIEGADYSATSATLTFNPGDTDKIINIPIINNALPQGNRTVTMLLSNAVGTLLYSPSNAVLTIIDTLSAPGELRFDTDSYLVSENDATAYLTIVRTNGSSGSVSVSFATVSGTAAPGVNYVDSRSTVSFGDGVTSRVIPIPLLDNNLVQGAVNFSVMLFEPTGEATLVSPTNAIVNVLDNDSGVAFVNATNFVSEADSVATLFVQRIGGTNGDFSVSYSTTNGTALAGTNYSTVAGSLSFTNGEALKTILVPMIVDPRVTGDLTFTVGLSDPSAPALLATPSATTVIIHDADAGLSFPSTKLSVFKNSGNAVITVICSNPGVEPVIVDTNTVPLSVNYYTTNGTGTAGVDYVATSGTLIFTNGIGTNTFVVPLINNAALKGDRTFTVGLSNATPPGQLVFPSNQVVTIVDNNPRLSFSRSTYTVSKSGVSANITVLRTGYTNNVASVDFLATNDTAIAGQNFASTNGTLVFTNGVTNQTFSVVVFDNSISQPNKTVWLQLSNPTNGFLTAPSAATLTIFDASGSLVVPSGSALISESGPTNGIIDPNETVTLLFAFRVAGGTNVADLQATLLATNGITASSLAGSQSYGPLTAFGPSSSRAFTFTAQGTNTQPIAATFNLQDGTKDLGQAIFTYTLGQRTNIFANPATIRINESAVASPYPSIITVSNMGSALLKATVTLNNLTHNSIHDVDALVVAPNQQDTLIMTHVGTPGVAASHITLTFDDAATNSLPSTGAISSGTNKPTAYPTLPVFP